MLSRTVKILNFYPTLKLKINLQSIMDVGQRHETSGSETMDIITQNTESSLNFMFTSIF